MQPRPLVRACVFVCALVAAAGDCSAGLRPRATDRTCSDSPNPTGILRTYNVNGSVDFDNPFFQSLGTNGRSCGSCHHPADGWTIVPSHVQARFDATDGEDPIFRTNDGSNSPNRRRVDRRGETIRLQHAAHERAHPRRHRHAAQRGVRADRRRRSVRLRLGHRTVAVPPSAAGDESAVPRDGHVGWPPDVPRPVDSFRSERPGQRRHAGPCRRRSIR